jgi:hypothetical protein
MRPVELDAASIAVLPAHELVTYAKDQPEYIPLPVARLRGPEGCVLSRWSLTAEERARIAAGEDLFIEMWTFGGALQPVRPSIGLGEMYPSAATVDVPSTPIDATASPTIRTDWTRGELIAICERAVVAVSDWNRMEGPEAHEKLGLCWVLLKAGCDVDVMPPSRPGVTGGCATTDQHIWVVLSWPSASDLRMGFRPQATTGSNCAAFRLPTPARLNQAAGKDWY